MIRRILALAVVALPLFSACAVTDSYTPSASPTWSDAARCERNGGVWHQNLDICEMIRR